MPGLACNLGGLVEIEAHLFRRMRVIAGYDADADLRGSPQNCRRWIDLPTRLDETTSVEIEDNSVAGTPFEDLVDEALDLLVVHSRWGKDLDDILELFIRDYTSDKKDCPLAIVEDAVDDGIPNYSAFIFKLSGFE